MPHLSRALTLTLLGCLGCGTHSENRATTESDCPASGFVKIADLGQLKPGKAPAFTFLVRNTTDTSFKITSVQKSCGCETTGLDEGVVIAPGAVLKAPYMLSDRQGGDIHGRLLIKTNSIEPEFSSIVLTLAAHLPRKLWATPSGLYFDVAAGGTEAQQLVVSSEWAELLSNAIDVSTYKGLVDVTLESRDSDSLAFRVVPASRALEGEAYDFIVIRVLTEDSPRLNVRVRVRGSSPSSPVDPPDSTARADSSGRHEHG